MTFQIGIAKKQGRGGRRTLPYGFTQEGVAMLSSVLNSERAREVNIAILRTFSKLRKDSESKIQLNEKFEQLEASMNKQFATLSHNVRQVMSAVEATSVRGAAAKYYQISVLDLKSTSRAALVALPRQVSMYLIRYYTGFSYKRIGTILGGKDHSTILHGCHKMEVDLTAKSEVCEAMESIKSYLRAKGINPK